MSSSKAQQATWRRAAAVFGLTAILFGATVACSDDKADDASAGPSTTAPEEKISSDADVAAGLNKMVTISASVAAAGTDEDAAMEADSQLEPIWKDIEGTVKQNDPIVYTDIEDSLSLLETGAESGDTEKTEKGASDISESVTSYLVTYPG